MAKAVQQRTLKTRARLLDAALGLVSAAGYSALRVEEVVLKAGVAKGTFFSHFKDKDALMEVLIGEALHRIIDDLEQAPPPASPAEITERLMPLFEMMMSERYVFDIILRYSGAAGLETVGPIAQTFDRLGHLYAAWSMAPGYRKDVPPDTLGEGIMAFATQAMATEFCALHNATSVSERLTPFLETWLIAPQR